MTSAFRNQNREIAALMTDFVSRTAGFYEHLPDRPVCRTADDGALRRIERRTIPVSGRPLGEVYEEMLRDVYANTLLAQHPRSFACVPSTASLLSWAGDVMTNAFNPHDSCRINAPAAVLIEQKLIRWMCDLAGYPAGGGGLFVSGGSIANLTALTAARDAKLTWKERSRAVIYVSDQTHASVSKGLHIIGFDRSQIRVIPSDRQFRMDAARLADAAGQDLAAGKRPFAVAASAGTTNTGSVDPLPEIAALCREYDIMDDADLRLQHGAGTEPVRPGAQLRGAPGVFERLGDRGGGRRILGPGAGADPPRQMPEAVADAPGSGLRGHGRGD